MELPPHVLDSLDLLEDEDIPLFVDSFSLISSMEACIPAASSGSISSIEEILPPPSSSRILAVIQAEGLIFEPLAPHRIPLRSTLRSEALARSDARSLPRPSSAASTSSSGSSYSVASSLSQYSSNSLYSSDSAYSQDSEDFSPNPLSLPIVPQQCEWAHDWCFQQETNPFLPRQPRAALGRKNDATTNRWRRFRNTIAEKRKGFSTSLSTRRLRLGTVK